MKQNQMWTLAESYLAISSSDQSPIDYVVDLPDAYACGYITSLHVHRTYSPALSLEGEALIEYIQQDLQEALLPQLAQACLEYLQPDLRFINATRSELLEVFLQGYIAGIHRSGKYDMAILDSDHCLVTRILADILLFQEQWRNSQRACCRIIRNRYGSTKQNKLKSMALDGARLNDDGTPAENTIS